MSPPPHLSNGDKLYLHSQTGVNPLEKMRCASQGQPTFVRKEERGRGAGEGREQKQESRLVREQGLMPSGSKLEPCPVKDDSADRRKQY